VPDEILIRYWYENPVEFAGESPRGRICYYLAYISLYKVRKLFELFGSNRSYVVVDSWVHKANLQLVLIVSEIQFAVDKNELLLQIELLAAQVS
jgi:hypothetical protein